MSSAPDLESAHHAGGWRLFANLRTASQYLFLSVELQLTQEGVYLGYYPEGTIQKISSFVREVGVRPWSASPIDAKDRSVPLADFIDEFDWDYAFSVSLSVRQQARNTEHLLSQYPILCANWQDAATKDLQRCVELTMFSDATIWLRSIEEVEAVYRRIRKNPSLMLSTSEVDRISWALTGASDLFEESPIDWSLLFTAFTSDKFYERRDDLIRVRSQLENLRDLLTDRTVVAIGNPPSPGDQIAETRLDAW